MVAWGLGLDNATNAVYLQMTCRPHPRPSPKLPRAHVALAVMHCGPVHCGPAQGGLRGSTLQELANSLGCGVTTFQLRLAEHVQSTIISKHALQPAFAAHVRQGWAAVHAVITWLNMTNLTCHKHARALSLGHPPITKQHSTAPVA